MNNKILTYSVSIMENQLVINNNIGKRTVDLPSPIKQIEKCDEIIVVRVNPKISSFLNENIFGVSYEGKILWQIEKIKHMDTQSPFMGMGQDENGFSAYNWDSFNYKIDLKTEKIIDRQYVK